MGGFPADRDGFVIVDGDVHEGKGAIGGGLFNGVDEVFSQGVELVVESIRVISFTEVSFSVADKVSVGVGRIRKGIAFCLCYSDLRHLEDKWGTHGSSTILRVEFSVEFEVGTFKAVFGLYFSISTRTLFRVIFLLDLLIHRE